LSWWRNEMFFILVISIPSLYLEILLVCYVFLSLSNPLPLILSLIRVKRYVCMRRERIKPKWDLKKTLCNRLILFSQEKRFSSYAFSEDYAEKVFLYSKYYSLVEKERVGMPILASLVSLHVFHILVCVLDADTNTRLDDTTRKTITLLRLWYKMPWCFHSALLYAVSMVLF